MENSTRLDSYVKAIKPIAEGLRNETLYAIGLTLRKNFGLTGNALEEALSEVNQAKCTPPLPPDEVTTIARSVDESDVPIGESSTTHSGQRGKKAFKPRERPVYVVSPSADAVVVASLLRKKVSIYPHCKTNEPIAAVPIGGVLKKFKVGGDSKALIDTIRAEPEKEKRNALKKELPAVVFGSEPQAIRNTDACNSNGIICLDFDSIPEDGIEEAKAKIAAVPYVFCVGLSASGRGIFALAAYEGTPELKPLIAAMQSDFPNYKIDPSRSDVVGLRYVTHDENIIVKDEVYPAVLTEHSESENDSDNGNKLAWIPFPVDVFPAPLRNYIIESAKAAHIDPAYVGAFVLSVVGSIIGSSFRIQLKRGWREPPIIWTALVVLSGSGKSPGLDAAKEPLDSLQEKADEEYIEAVLEYEKELTIYNAKLGQWRGELRKKNSSSELPAKPQAPIHKVYVVDDTTPEALMEILSENPHGVGMPKDELSGWIGGFGAYGKGKDTKELAFWLASHGCQSHRVNRKGNTGGAKKLIAASTPAVCVCGGIQPGMLRKLLTENKHYFDSGLVARILFAMPPDRSQRWTEDEVSDETREKYEKLINEICSWRSNYSLNPKEPEIIKLSETAKKKFTDFLNANADERDSMESDTQKAIWPKLTGYAARIALIFHVVKWWNNEADDYYNVDAETMEAAIQLVQWFKRESLRIIEAMCGEAPQVDLEERAIIRVIRRKVEVKAGVIAQYVRAYHGKGGTDRALAKLEAMVQKGLLTSEYRKEGNGAMVKYYSLSPTAETAIPESIENGIDGIDNGVDADFDCNSNDYSGLGNGVDKIDSFDDYPDDLPDFVPEASDYDNGIDIDDIDEDYETTEPPLDDELAEEPAMPSPAEAYGRVARYSDEVPF